MEQYVKDKIRLSMTGHKHSDETKRKISDGQKLAWSRIPYRNQDDENYYTGINNKNEDNKDGKQYEM